MKTEVETPIHGSSFEAYTRHGLDRAMRITFDPAKSGASLRQRGIDFADAAKVLQVLSRTFRIQDSHTPSRGS